MADPGEGPGGGGGGFHLPLCLDQTEAQETPPALISGSAPRPLSEGLDLPLKSTS